MKRAWVTSRGSAVIMPLTSVKISTRFAFKAAPRMAADVSEPPRPIVVMWPLSVAPWKPVTTTTSASIKASVIGFGSTRRIFAFWKSSLVTMPASWPVMAVTFRPCLRANSVKTAVEMVSPTETNMSSSRLVKRECSAPTNPSNESVA